MDKDGLVLQSQYRRLLEHLSKQHGLLGLVFRKAQNKIQDLAKPARSHSPRARRPPAHGRRIAASRKLWGCSAVAR